MNIKERPVPLSDKEKINSLLGMMNVLLDQCDYLEGNCMPTNQVAAVLPRQVLLNARNIMEVTKP